MPCATFLFLCAVAKGYIVLPLLRCPYAAYSRYSGRNGSKTKLEILLLQAARANWMEVYYIKSYFDLAVSWKVSVLDP